MATAHEIARKLLTLPDLPLLDVYAEQTIEDVKKYSYDSGSGEKDCIVYETDDFVPDDEEPEDEEPEDEDPGEKEE
jgi:hypothetical protein